MQSAHANLFRRILVRQVDTNDSLHGALTHLWWSAPNQGDLVVQVYANGQLHAVTIDPAQRELWLVFPPGRPMRLALCAVDRAEAWVPQDLDAESSPRDTVSAIVLRDPAVPIGARVGISTDGQSAEQAPLFRGDSTRIGFGSVFGYGGFGIDAATGPGLGLGELGFGPLGSDGSAWRWRRDDLPVGAHALVLSLTDADDQPIADPAQIDIEIDRLPPPPIQLAVDDNLTLSWS
ncbi:hypothetical protein OT109_10075 [Phycisphaeraceae bacterium D3-23]